MNRIQKLFTIIGSIVYAALGIFMILNPENGYLLMVAILAILLSFSGIKTLFYYLTMARFMVGGKTLLFKGLILLDFGIFTTSLNDVPRIYVLLYLAIIHAFSGLVEILRAGEARKFGARSWKLKFAHGLLNVFVAVSCFAFTKSADRVVIIYSLGLIYSSILSIISALRRTTMIYIQ